MNHEDLLRDTLSAKAAEASVDLTVDDVRRDAARRRTLARRRAMVGLAAAAVIAVVVPTAVLLRPAGDEPAPAPPRPSAPSSTPPSTPTVTAPPGPMAHGMKPLPQTAAPGVTYLQDSVIHLASGGTERMPATSPQGDFAAYHGGWLVCAPETSKVEWYDNTGRLKRRSDGWSRLAASPDGMRLAFPMDGKILVGITTGMGEGERAIPVGKPQEAWPVGFLADGTVVFMDGGQVKTDRPIAQPLPPAMAEARAVSVDDVVAGTDRQGRGMAWSARTGATLWSGSSWTVTAFSPDGRYAAATSTDTNAVAILDARTGEVVAHLDFDGHRVDPTSDPVIDTDGSLLVSGTDGRTMEQAVLRLAPDGTLSRATEVFPLDPASDSQQIRFAVGR